jgi:hypothetical protein
LDHLIAMRFAERFLAVIIGGLAIYFGYRLFLSLPQSTDAEGRFKLPWNTSIVLSRVGPGVFFALFGSLIVGCSFFRSIQYREGPPARTVNQGSTPSREFAGSKQLAEGSDALHDARMLLQRDIAMLNNVPAQLDRKMAPFNRTSVESGIHRIKLELMETVWGSDWGDRGALKEWMESPDDTVPAGINKEAVVFYRYGLNENP